MDTTVNFRYKENLPCHSAVRGKRTAKVFDLPGRIEGFFCFEALSLFRQNGPVLSEPLPRTPYNPKSGIREEKS